MAAERQELRKIAEAASLEQVQQLLAFAAELGIEIGSEEPESLVDIRVLYPSGEVALDDQLPGRTSVGALLQKLSAGSDGTPGRLSLLCGTEVLKRGSTLKQLNLTDDDCLYLVRRSAGTYTEWTPLTGTLEAQYDHLAKCVMLGGEAAGKTALLHAFSREPFQDDIPPTIGIDFKIVNLRSEDGMKLKVQLWDTAGQARFRTITRSYLRGAEGFLAVFSVCSRASWDELLELLQAAQDINPEACRCLCLVGTHADRPGREVSEQEVLELAASKKCQHFEVSSKLRHDIDAPLFAWLDAFLEARA